MRTANDVFSNIGIELMNSAKRRYTIGMVVEKVILVLSVLVGIFVWAETGEAVFFFSIAGGGVVEYIIGCGLIYLITTNRYARGEAVCLLQDIKVNTKRQKTQTEKTEKGNMQAGNTQTANVQGSAMKPTNPASPAPNTLIDDFWICGSCKTKNLNTRDTCWSCGNEKYERN
jgi:hypothetical protein